MNVSQTLMVHTGALGDFVLTVHLARRLRPSSEIHALTRQPVACYFCKAGLLDGWKHIESAAFATLFHDDPVVPEAVRAYLQGFDRIVSMAGDSTSVIHRRLLSLGQQDVFSIEPGPGPASNQHITEQWIDRLKAQGLRLGAEQVRQANRVSSGRVLIQPGSGGVPKCWPLERFVDVAIRLTESGCAVSFVVGPAEIERGMIDQLTIMWPHADVVRSEDSGGLVGVIEQAGVFVGNDAGPTHLAAALGIPTIAIFVATDCKVWRPLGPKVAVLESPTAPEVVSHVLNGRAESVLNGG
jgi:hypothetical protein